MSESKLNAKGMVSAGSIVFLSQIGTTLCFLLSLILVLSNLEKSENGVFFFIQKGGELGMMLLVEAGMTNIIIRYIIRYRQRADAILSTLLRMRFVLWAAVSVLMMATTWVFAPSHIVAVAYLCGWYLFANRAAIVRFSFEAERRSHNNYAVVASAALLDAVLYLLLLYFWQADLTPTRVFQIQCLSAIPGFVLIAATSNLRQRFTAGFHPKIAALLYRSAIPVVLTMILIQLHDKIDVIALEYFWNTSELGIYGAAYRVNAPFILVLSTLIFALVPVIVYKQKMKHDNWNEFMFVALKGLMLAGTGIAIVGAIWHQLIIEVLSGGLYSDVPWQFIIMVFAAIPVLVVDFTKEMNIALGHQKRNYWLAWTLLIATTVCAVTLTPWLGSLGTTLSRLVSLSAASAASFYALHLLLTRQQHRKLLFRVTVAVVLSGGFTVFCIQVFEPIIATCIALPVFLGLVFATGSMSVAEIKEFVALVRR